MTEAVMTDGIQIKTTHFGDSCIRFNMDEDGYRKGSTSRFKAQCQDSCYAYCIQQQILQYMLSFERKKKQNGIWKEVLSLQFVLVSPPSPCFFLVCVCCMGVSSSVLAPGRSQHLLTSISSAAAKGSVVSHPLIARLFHQQLWYELSESFFFFSSVASRALFLHLQWLNRQCQLHVFLLFPAPGLYLTLARFVSSRLPAPSFSSATISVNIPVKSPLKHSCVSALLSKNKILLVNMGFFPQFITPLSALKFSNKPSYSSADTVSTHLVLHNYHDTRFKIKR